MNRWHYALRSRRPDPEREKRRGAAAHRLAAELLTERLAGGQTTARDRLGRRVDHFPVTEEFAASVDRFVDFCAQYLKVGATVLIEEPLPRAGRVDFAAVLDDHAVIVEFKHGRNQHQEDIDEQLARYERGLRIRFPELETVYTYSITPRRRSYLEPANTMGLMIEPQRPPPRPRMSFWQRILKAVRE